MATLEKKTRGPYSCTICGLLSMHNKKSHATAIETLMAMPTDDLITLLTNILKAKKQTATSAIDLLRPDPAPAANPSDWRNSAARNFFTLVTRHRGAISLQKLSAATIFSWARRITDGQPYNVADLALLSEVQPAAAAAATTTTAIPAAAAIVQTATAVTTTAATTEPKKRSFTWVSPLEQAASDLAAAPPTSQPRLGELHIQIPVELISPALAAVAGLLQQYYHNMTFTSPATEATTTATTPTATATMAAAVEEISPDHQ